MSVKVMSAVFDRYPAGGGERLLALALADVARDDGVLMLRDSVPELARKTMQTDRGVQKQLRRMLATGWLQLQSASDGGKRRVSSYRISHAWIEGAALRGGTDEPAATPDAPDSDGPKPRTTFTGERGSPVNAATFRGERGSPAIKTNSTKEIRAEIPPTPKGADGVREEGSKPERGALMTLKAWLAQCEAFGEKPIPKGDPVFAYAESVGIGPDVLALHWREFKRRRSEALGKRQRDWRQTFRNSVRDNWFRLWYLKPGVDAQLSTTGLQALALMQAEQQQASALAQGEGDAA